MNSHFLFSILRVGCSVLAKPRSAAHTDHMKVGLGCLCRILAPMHMEWGLKQVFRVWVLTSWKYLVQVFRFCVSELTESNERHIKLWGVRLFFCVSGSYLCASHTNPVGDMGALVFSISSLQSSHLLGWQRELSHSVTYVQFQETFSVATAEVWMSTEDLLFPPRNQWWIDSQLNTKHTGLKVNLPFPG